MLAPLLIWLGLQGEGGGAPALPDPRTLPSAPAERWRSWTPAEAPPEELREPYRLCLQSYLEGELVRALVGLEALLERAPDWPPALQLAGVASFRLRRYGDTVELLERFLRQAPQELGMTRALGHALYSLGRHEEAAAHYERLLALAPTSAETWFGRALALYRLGREEGALAALGQVLELAPEHGEATYWKAQLLWDRGENEAAKPLALRATELRPYDPAAWHLLFRIHTELGEEGSARAAEERYAVLGPLDSRAQSLESQLLYHPEGDALRLELLDVRERMGDRARAAEVLGQLLKRNPGSAVLLQLALERFAAWEMHQRARDAASELELAAPEDPAACLALHRYWRSRGETLRSVQAGERYLRFGGDPAVLQGSDKE